MDEPKKNRGLFWQEKAAIGLGLAVLIAIITIIAMSEDRQDCLKNIADQLCMDFCEVINIGHYGSEAYVIKAMNTSSRQRYDINFLPSELKTCKYT